jgi:hypothetical protein
MNYIIICIACLIFIHFCLYYLNIDLFKLSNNILSNNVLNNNVVTNTKVSNTVLDNNIDTSIEDSINQLKNLNKYIDNGHTSIANNSFI